MKINPTRIINLIVVFIVLFLNYSCNKDSDLLADYVVDGSAGKPGNVIDLEDGTILTFEDKMVAINIRDIRSSVARKGVIVKKVTQPNNGKAEIKTDSVIVYTPSKDFSGKDDFTVTVEETAPDSTIVEKENTIVIAVNPVLEPVEDKVQTPVDKNVVIDVLKNDTFSKKNNATVSQTTAPAKGAVAINKDNTLTYTPNVNASGTDTFKYTAKVENADKTASTSKEATVTVDIEKKENKSDISMGNELLAFPGAVGHGRHTTGGRGGDIYQVTNLNDSGPGSFREAVSKGNRTIVFRVSGVIKINSRLYFGGDNITIAGQTAPGEGIAIYGRMVDTDNHENIIMRYVNFLCGDSGVTGDDDAFRVKKVTPGTASNFIFDHCGFFWGKDEVLSFEANNSEQSSIKDVTVQRSIIAESLNSYGLILWKKNYNISIINNLFANNGQRNIRASTRYSTFEMINNVIFGYDWATNPAANNEFDIIGNVYQSNSTNDIVHLEPSEGGDIKLTKAYIYDNTLNGGKGKISSNLKPYLKDSRQVSSGYKPISSSLVKDDILSDVGSNLNGNNKLSQSQIDDVINNSISRINSIAGSVGISIQSSNKAYLDADMDGMDDNWETANGLNPKNASDGKAKSGGVGYTNLEVFLHYLTLK